MYHHLPTSPPPSPPPPHLPPHIIKWNFTKCSGRESGGGYHKHLTSNFPKDWNYNKNRPKTVNVWMLTASHGGPEQWILAGKWIWQTRGDTPYTIHQIRHHLHGGIFFLNFLETLQNMTDPSETVQENPQPLLIGVLWTSDWSFFIKQIIDVCS